jgi:hypothetical protein
MHIIFGNYGDNTIAVMQWSYQRQLSDVTVIDVDTGWAALRWQDRVQAGKQLAKRYFFKTITLKPPRNFAELILDRHDFPTQKYQWCPTFLKAIPLLQWLDENDSSGSATIILGSSRSDSRARSNLVELYESSEYFDDRSVWYPLCHATKKEKRNLIQQTGLPMLNQRSLECNPCIHSDLAQLAHLSIDEIVKVTELEQKTGQVMFQGRYPNKDIVTVHHDAKAMPTQRENSSLEMFDLGCGSRYVCGE